MGDDDTLDLLIMQARGLRFDHGQCPELAIPAPTTTTTTIII